MSETIEKPGPMSEYTSRQEFDEALDSYRQELARTAGVTAEQLHEMGPDTMEHLLGELGIALVERKPAEK